jgi:hypothetical protein
MFGISTNIRRTALTLPLCILGMSAGGCGFVQSPVDLGHITSENIDTRQKDPSKLIDQTFEVDQAAKFAGVKNYKTILALRQDAIANGRSAKTSFLDLGLLTADYIKAGLVIELNTESNDEDKKINLLFQVLEVRKFDDQEDFLKIKLLNKKYFDTKWWISSYEFSRLAKRPGQGLKWKLPF